MGSSTPRLSVILVLYGKAPLTLQCLLSLAKQPDPLEVIVINNGKDRLTRWLLQRLEGARIVSKDHNVGFLRAANEGARLATTPTLLFLNNDTRLKPLCIHHAYVALKEEPGAGAVGAKIVGFDNRLLEAGAAIWQDGSTECLGRGQPPAFNRFNYRRDTDYVSGCFLLTPRDLFEKLDGFDEAYAPAYYEDTDYCLRLWKAGYRVIYEPRAEIEHFENASSPSPKAARRLMVRNKEVFFERHQDVLLRHTYPNTGPRDRRRGECVYRPKKQLLYLDDRVPHLFQGSGFPRSNLMIQALTRLGWQVTLYPVTYSQRETWQDTYEDLSPQVRIEWDKGLEGLPYFLNFNRDTFDAIWVSRAHNLNALRRAMKIARVPQGIAPIVFDSEAIAADRNFLLQPDLLLMGRPALEAAREAEMSIARWATRVVAVNARDRETYEQAGLTSVHEVGHVVESLPSEPPFEARQGILFLGNLDEDGSPNVLALEHFIARILPLIRQTHPLTLDVVGSCRSSRIQRLREMPGVHLRGMQKRLEPYLDRVRLMIAPHNVGAGLPLKVIHGSAAGIPSVVSPLLQSQLGWEDGLAVANPSDPQAFARRVVEVHESPAVWNALRLAALKNVQRDYCPERFHSQVRAAIEGLFPEEGIPVVHRRREGLGYRPEGSPTQ